MNQSFLQEHVLKRLIHQGIQNCYRTLLKSKFFNFIETAFTFMQFYIEISHLFAQWKQV